MPEIRYYTVVRTQRLRLSANSPIEAAEAADTVFKGEVSLSDEMAQRGIRVREPIRDLGFEVKEDC